jgi:hypothetical protein
MTPSGTRGGLVHFATLKTRARLGCREQPCGGRHQPALAISWRRRREGPAAARGIFPRAAPAGPISLVVSSAGVAAPRRGCGWMAGSAAPAICGGWTAAGMSGEFKLRAHLEFDLRRGTRDPAASRGGHRPGLSLVPGGDWPPSGAPSRARFPDHPTVTRSRPLLSSTHRRKGSVGRHLRIRALGATGRVAEAAS